MLILGVISETFISVGIWIVSGIYHVASFAFQVFLILASNQLLDDTIYETIISNFYILLGIVMLFVISFTLLKGMVSEDEQKKGATTVRKIIINLITSTIILALLPTIFGFAFDFQDAFISNQNTIGRFFGYGNLNADSDNPSNSTNLTLVRQGAYQITNGVFTAFLNVNGSNCEAEGDTPLERLESCQEQIPSDTIVVDGISGEYTFSEVVGEVNDTGSFGLYGGFANSIDEGDLDFNFLLSLIAGCLLVYVAVSFCFDMGVRLVKLVFYQLIAPIPLFLRIVPEGKMSGIFNNWLKVTSTCYLEVYIRIFVFYFCVYLCKSMIDAGVFSKVFEYGYFIGLLSEAFVLMGIIVFMKQAPKLFSEVTGISSGNMKLGIKDKLAEGGAFTAGAILGGGITAGVRNATNAFTNTRNKYYDYNKDTKKWERKAGVNTGQIIGSAFGGVKSIIGGTGSGFFRGGKAGLTAKSPKDMKNAARTGAQASIDARVKRANYRAAHSAGGPWYDDLARVGRGHLRDLGSSAAAYAGVKNIEQLKRENYAMDTITTARDNFDNDVDSLIMKEVAKGKSDITGISIENFAAKKMELENARAHGNVTAEMETDYNNLLKEIRYQLQEKVLVSDDHWEGYSDDDQAKLSSIRVDAVKYKGVVRNNASLDALRESGIVGADFADDVDVRLGEKGADGVYKDIPVIDEMGNAIKRNKGTNNVSIAQKEQQKYDDKK